MSSGNSPSLERSWQSRGYRKEENIAPERKEDPGNYRPVSFSSVFTLQQIDTPVQLGVIHKVTELALKPLVQTIHKDIKQNRTKQKK